MEKRAATFLMFQLHWWAFICEEWRALFMLVCSPAGVEKGSWSDHTWQKLQFFMGEEESSCVCLLLLVGEEGHEAWGEVSTFSAYLTFSCLMFRNSTRLVGSQRWGSTKTHGRSLYMNHKEFPILILAGPSRTQQYISLFAPYCATFSLIVLLNFTLCC